MTEELLEHMRQQHEHIRKMIRDVEKEAAETDINYPTLMEKLTLLKSAVFEHLTFEDSKFYPELAKKMRECNQSPAEMLGFGEKMTGITLKARDFFNMYDSEEAIKSQVDKFRMDLVNILTKLNMRMSSEDVFAYSEWNRCSIEEKNNK